jgi:CPA1 family monovalent cation:H+ antiporter
MAGLTLVLLLLAVSVALRIVAERLPVPYPALLVVGGLALALVPHVPRFELPPDVLFLVFVPPLLFIGAVGFPLRDLKRDLGPIVRMSVVMVLVTIGAVAVTAHAVDPAFTWAAAFALGAIVAPPDPVAVLSLMRVLHMPRRIERILEGEGLLNDATALVAYRIAVVAAVTGVFSPWRAALQFLAVAAGGVGVGLAVGVVIIWLHRATRSVDVADNTLSLLTPFAAYLPAELIRVSGVVAVVTTAMYVARRLRTTSPATRLQRAAMVSVVSFLLESLVFIFIGVELPNVTNDLRILGLQSVIRSAAIISVAIIVVRVIWVFPSTYIGGSIGRWVRHSNEPLPPWRGVLFIGWAGLRGGDSLVIALTLPLVTARGTPFPARDRILFITFSVIFATLVLQGATLRPVARWLGLHDDGGTEEEEAHARLTAAEAGLRALESPTSGERAFPEVVAYLRQRHRQRARRWAAREARQDRSRPADSRHTHLTVAPSHDAGLLDERRAAEYRRLRTVMIDAEQAALIDLRDRGEIGDDVMRSVQRELDLEEELLANRDPVVEPASEVRMGVD